MIDPLGSDINIQESQQGSNGGLWFCGVVLTTQESHQHARQRTATRPVMRGIHANPQKSISRLTTSSRFLIAISIVIIAQSKINNMAEKSSGAWPPQPPAWAGTTRRQDSNPRFKFRVTALLVGLFVYGYLAHPRLFNSEPPTPDGPRTGIADDPMNPWDSVSPTLPLHTLI